MESDSKRSEWTQGLGLILAFAAVKLLIHLLTSHGYGYFRDELYFLDCARNFDWGYVDHAPLIGYYEQQSMLTRIDGSQTKAVNFSALQEALSI